MAHDVVSGDADAWIVEHIIVNMASNKKSRNISQQIPQMENKNCFVGVSREGGNENHHFVVVTRVEQKARFEGSPDVGPRMW